MPQFEQGTVIFRYWDEQHGLSETTASFTTIEELFDLCVQSSSNLLVDRILVNGLDDTGISKVITLRFQSIAEQRSE